MPFAVFTAAKKSKDQKCVAEVDVDNQTTKSEIVFDRKLFQASKERRLNGYGSFEYKIPCHFFGGHIAKARFTANLDTKNNGPFTIGYQAGFEFKDSFIGLSVGIDTRDGTDFSNLEKYDQASLQATTKLFENTWIGSKTLVSPLLRNKIRTDVGVLHHFGSKDFMGGYSFKVKDIFHDKIVSVSDWIGRSQWSMAAATVSYNIQQNEAKGGIMFGSPIGDFKYDSTGSLCYRFESKQKNQANFSVVAKTNVFNPKGVAIGLGFSFLAED